MPIVATSTGELAYDERGSGPAVVFLNSGAHRRSDFDAVRALLPSTWRTIALDWPAHGDSPPGRVAPTAMTFADAAAEATATLAPDGAVLVGCSVGGYAAARLAIRQPELVRALVLIDSGGFSAYGVRERIFCALMARPRFLRAIYPGFARRYLQARTAGAEQVREQAVATVRSQFGGAAVSGVWGSFPHSDHDLRTSAAQMTAPTLVLWGRKDPVMPLRIGRAAASTITGAELAIVDAGHLPHVTHPEEVAQHLTTFLDRVAPGRGAAPQIAPGA